MLARAIKQQVEKGKWPVVVVVLVDAVVLVDKKGKWVFVFVFVRE